MTSPRTPSWQSVSWISASAAPATCVCGMSRSTICQCPEGIRAANFSSVVCDLLSRVVEDGAKRRPQTTRPPGAALDAGELTINLQLQRVGRELLLRETKTEASDGVLPYPELVGVALADRALEQDKDRVESEVAWQGEVLGSGLVFTGHYGTPIDPRTLNRRFDARCATAGVRRLRVHDARKTCATLLVDLDVHPRVIMRVLRHADVAVTMEVYANASAKSTREALRKLGESLA